MSTTLKRACFNRIGLGIDHETDALRWRADETRNAGEAAAGLSSSSLPINHNHWVAPEGRVGLVRVRVSDPFKDCLKSPAAESSRLAITRELLPTQRLGEI